MKRFDTCGEYLFDLLFGPLKRGRYAANQFRVFFGVVGRIFDGMKRDVFRVRSEANVVTASPAMLAVHGRDRDMPRLPGEDDEQYRTRLYMKGLISEWGGTKRGVLYALAALGYEQSYIEPMTEHDPARWAEFIVFLRGSAQSGVNNLSVIDAEVMRVKEASSLPSYGMDAGNTIKLVSELQTGWSRYPRCGEIVCGVFPRRTSVGCMLESNIRVGTRTESGVKEYLRCAEKAELKGEHN